MALNKVEICGVDTSKLPILKEEEKKALFERIKAGDKEAKEEYIKGNLRLVLSVIRRFSNSNENADDLSQIGCVGRLTVVEADLADAMERTVKLRNKLAHGNDSFSRIGSTLLIQDIKKDYDIITEYLSTSLKYFEEYINKKVYLRKS